MASVAVPQRLDMGIWWNDGEKIWMPKVFRQSRNDAKRFAVAECYSDWIAIRVRTVWIKEIADPLWPNEYSYRRADKTEEGAIECWEIDT